tara:strand:- start:21877 stop:22629 length:753 start_codon:yes stop_codon:yes gene_type:complete
MAVSIDTVYQKVLAIANKEQRGYITPIEFNLFAEQAQLDIFENYFADLDKAQLTKGVSTEYGDMVDTLASKIAPFQKFSVDMSAIANTNEVTLPTSTAVHRLGTVFYEKSSDNFVEVERVEINDLRMMQQTGLFKPSANRPVYVYKTNAVLKIFPSSNTPSYATSNISCNYIAKPTTPYWNYVVVPQSAGGNEYPLHDSTNTVNFELHPSEEDTLVFKILELAGILLNKPGLVGIAAGKDKDNRNVQVAQ